MESAGKVPQGPLCFQLTVPGIELHLISGFPQRACSDCDCAGGEQGLPVPNPRRLLISKSIKSIKQIALPPRMPCKGRGFAIIYLIWSTLQSSADGLGTGAAQLSEGAAKTPLGNFGWKQMGWKWGKNPKKQHSTKSLECL